MATLPLFNPNLLQGLTSVTWGGSQSPTIMYGTYEVTLTSNVTLNPATPPVGQSPAFTVYLKNANGFTLNVNGTLLSATKQYGTFFYTSDGWVGGGASSTSGTSTGGTTSTTPTNSAGDTTPPSQPNLKVSSSTDTNVTLAVTRGQDDESTPTLYGRYYVAGASTKPAFAPISLSGGNWSVDGLTQNTQYTFEVEEISTGGTSAVRTLSTTTAKTKGWVDSSTANFTAPDGTDPATLTMSDGQAIAKTGSGAAAILHNALTLSTAQAGVENGANGFIFPASSTLKMGRVKATYAFKAGSGAATVMRLGLKGTYPLGLLILQVTGDGAISFDTGGSNSTWNAPTWTGPTTGYAQSGTISISIDADNKTVWAWMNGVQVGSITTAATIPGMSSGTADLNLWGGGGISVSNLEIMSYQS